MSRIEFQTAGTCRSVNLEPDDTGRTLLAIARRHGVPILFNCEALQCLYSYGLVQFASPAFGLAEMRTHMPQNRRKRDLFPDYCRRLGELSLSDKAYIAGNVNPGGAGAAAGH